MLTKISMRFFLYSLHSLIFLLFAGIAFGQPEKEKKIKGALNQELKAKKALNKASIINMNKAGFIFYIPTKTKNIAAMQRVIDSPKTNSKTSIRVQKQQQKLMESAKARSEALQEAFSNYFDFCPVYMTYDTNAYKIKNKETGWFIDDSGNYDPNIVLDAETKHRVIISNTPGSTASSQLSLILKKAQDPQLDFPFPYFAVFRNSFNKRKLRKKGLLNDLDEKPLSVEARTIFIWNARLKNYHRRHLAE